jgi:hypothetical protein
VVQFGKISHGVYPEHGEGFEMTEPLLCLSFRADARNLSPLMLCPGSQTAPPLRLNAP